VEDDHVDRPGVEAQQCVKLTGTNNSFDLIVRIASAHQNETSAKPQKTPQKGNNQLLTLMPFADLVVMAERLHPIPFRTRP
jgi:hypothetical protein